MRIRSRVTALLAGLCVAAGASVCAPSAPAHAAAGFGMQEATSPAPTLAASAYGMVPAAPSSSESANEEPFYLEINDLAPRVLTDEKSVQISGVIGSKEARKDVSVDVYVRADSMVTVADAEAYMQDYGYPGDYVMSAKVGDIAAGERKVFSIKVPAEDLPLYSQFVWGPRGVEVSATSADDEAFDRTMLIWDSGYEVEATKLAVVSPVTRGVKNSREGVVSKDPTSAQLAVARSLAQMDGVTMAVGAGLLEHERFAAEIAEACSEPVISLPATDADVAGIAHLSSPAEIPQLVKDSKSASHLPSAEEAGLEVLDGFVIPEMEQLDTAVVRMWADQTVIVRGTGLGPTEFLTYDPSTWSRYDPQSGEPVTEEEPGVDVLVAHAALSRFLAQPVEGEAEELDLQQMVRATTAIITRQLPNESRTILALTGRGATSATLPERVQAALGERWVEPISVSEAIASSGEPTPRTSLPDFVETPGSITDAETAALYEAIESTAAMTSALEDSTGIVSEQRTRVLMATALELREQPNLRAALINGVNEEAEALATSVKVEQSAPINLLDRTARLPVRVSSTLNEPVNAVVELISPDPRLQIDHEVSVKVPASGSTLVEIPVRAVGSGNVTVQVKVKGPNGLTIDDATNLQIRVRAEWESTGTLVLSIVLALFLAFGIWRTIRNGRRMEVDDVHDEEAPAQPSSQELEGVDAPRSAADVDAAGEASGVDAAEGRQDEATEFGGADEQR
ncbi:MAG: DUF6049 family protein [Actinomycetaceae bacterium]|nr:DUF6049 family protein [Actinomycetaceae bacterium]